MSRDILLNSGNEFEIKEGDLALTSTTAEAVAQRIRIRLQTFRGEWFLNTRYGVPYFQRIFRKGASLDIVESILRRQISNIEGVESIAQLRVEVDPSVRRATVEFRVSIGEDAPLTGNEVVQI